MEPVMYEMAIHLGIPNILINDATFHLIVVDSYLEIFWYEII